jgi:hypothetical protein
MKFSQRHQIYTGLLFAGLAAASGSTIALEEFDEFVPIVEINASDGDVGFHVLLDGEGWEWVRIWNADNQPIFRARAFDGLRDQGGTEVFMESDEPPCWHDTEDEDYDPDEVSTVADFVEIFPEGIYIARGRTIEDEMLRSFAEFTHNLPAAPETEVEVELDEEEDDEEEDDGMYEVTVSWEPGEDLGECEYEDADIPDPAEVEVVRWEIVVEVNEDELPDEELPEGVPDSVFMVQLPGDARSVEVPEEFIQFYLDNGVHHFKYEVGAREEGGNQTFTEEEFTVGLEEVAI